VIGAALVLADIYYKVYWRSYVLFTADIDMGMINTISSKLITTVNASKSAVYNGVYSIT